MYYNVCFSPTGGTAKVADVIIGRLCKEHITVDLCHKVDDTELSEHDVCVVSVPSYSGRVPKTAIERLKRIRANGAAAILVCVYGNRAWEDTLTELQDTLVSCGFVCAAAVAAVAEHSIFRQFASGRPDGEDEKQLEGFADRIREILSEGFSGDMRLEGNHGTYKEVSGKSGLRPCANELCTSCLICAEECPVGAIDKNDPSVSDAELCIGCMRCISVCPRCARALDSELLCALSEKMAPRLSGRKGNYLFV